MSGENKQVFVETSRSPGWARAVRLHTEGPEPARLGGVGPAPAHVHTLSPLPPWTALGDAGLPASCPGHFTRRGLTKSLPSAPKPSDHHKQPLSSTVPHFPGQNGTPIPH